MLALTGAIDALRAANVVSAQRLYDWQLVSTDGGDVEASNELALRTVAITDSAAADCVVVCGGERSHDWAPPPLLSWLRGCARRGATVGAVSDGSFVVARAGLFRGVRSTIHWQCLDAYRERFPRLDIRASVFEIDRHRFSCAGGTAALDLLLTLIQRDHGVGLATAVADNYIHDRIRDSDSVQRLSGFYHLVRRSPPVAGAVRAMEKNIDSPLSIATIAAALAVSPRQLDRLFHRHTGTSPSRYYRDLRLSHARRLLVQTAMKVSEVAAATGFVSAAHLAGRFRAAHGVSPGEYRRTGNGTIAPL